MVVAFTFGDADTSITEEVEDITDLAVTSGEDLAIPELVFRIGDLTDTTEEVLATFVLLD